MAHMTHTSPYNQLSEGYLIYGFIPKIEGKPVKSFSNLISYISGMPDPFSSRQGDADIFRNHPAIEESGIDYYQEPMSFIQSGNKNGPYFIGVSDSQIHTDGTSPILIDLKFKALQGVEHRVTVDNYLSKHGLSVKHEDVDWHFIVSHNTNKG